jgi:hypothetical protein
MGDARDLGKVWPDRSLSGLPAVGAQEEPRGGETGQTFTILTATLNELRG